jgi:hypothetical protein
MYLNELNLHGFFKAEHEYSQSLNLNYAFTKKFFRAWKMHQIDYA